MPMEIHRLDWAAEYVKIPNALAQDSRVSYRARMVLVELLSRPPGWQTTADALWKKGQRERPGHAEGQEAVRKAMNELEKWGYVVRRRIRNERGHFSTVVHVYDTPGHNRDGDSATPVTTSGNAVKSKTAVAQEAVNSVGDPRSIATAELQTTDMPETATSVTTSGNAASLHVATDMAVSDAPVPGPSLVRRTTKTEVTKTDTKTDRGGGTASPSPDPSLAPIAGAIGPTAATIEPANLSVTASQAEADEPTTPEFEVMRRFQAANRLEHRIWVGRAREYFEGLGVRSEPEILAEALRMAQASYTDRGEPVPGYLVSAATRADRRAA